MTSRSLEWRPLLAVGAALLLLGCDALLPRRPVVGSALDSTAPARLAPKPARPAKRAPALSVEEENARFSAIRADLRKLVAAEETYYAENGTYTSDPERVRFRPGAGVAVRILWASRDGWAARGTHPDLGGRDCVVYVGSSRPAPATARYGHQAREGVPICDLPSPPRASRSGAVASASPGPSASAPDTASALDAVRPVVQMKVALRNLVRSQELWFGTQGYYSRRTEPFAFQFLWPRGVNLRILNAGRDSWSAKATHAKLPGRSCIIWSGPVPNRPVTDAKRRGAERAGVPVCDE
jgi:hypothetical protein